MDTRLLTEFEEAAIAWNPLIAGALRPGLPKAKVRRALQRESVSGDTDVLISIYAWRDGVLSQSINFTGIADCPGFFPGEAYIFLDLEMAIGHFRHCKSAAKNHPKLAEGSGRYFPLFWNGSVNWIGIDLAPGENNRVMLMQHRSDSPFREAYKSIDEFLADAIRANRQRDLLSCFRSR